jgi:hypothetical protein
VGPRKQRSEAGGCESTGSVLSLESCSKVVVPYGISDGGCLTLCLRMRTVSSGWNAASAYADKVRHGGNHRGRRPGHVDREITRELGRASSASCLPRRGSMRGRHPVGVHRDIKAPAGKSRHSAGSIHGNVNAEMTGTEGRANNAKELGTSVRQS